MNRTITLCFCCLLYVSFNALCQTDTIYLDSNWKIIADSTQAEYKRIAQINNIGYWEVVDYYKGGQVYMTGAFLHKEFKKPQGLFEWYYPSGQMKLKMIFRDGRPIDESFLYYENGQVDTYSKYDDAGKTHELKYYKEDGSESIMEHPEFPGGISSMYNYLSTNIRYPKYARRKNIMGRVVVTFYVHTDGSLQDVGILESPHDTLSEEATRVVKSMPYWKPGVRDQKIVRVKYNLPISFSLQ